MSRKLPDIILLAVFILTISVPLASPQLSPAQFWEQANPQEAGFSVARLAKAVVDFPPAFTAYFENHHLLRQQLVDGLQYVRFHLLRETIFPNVLIGKEDWLYYTGENNIADYECTSPFTAKELQAVRSRLLNWNDQLSARDIRFYIVFAPNKETIYPQYLPDGLKPGVNACRIDQVMQDLQKTELTVLDLRAPLQIAAQSTRVYHRTDTHWNAAGALLASREILALLKQDFPLLTPPSFNDYQEVSQPFSGDLAAFLPPDARFVEQATNLVPVFQPRAILEEGADRSIISSIPGSSLPRALVFRDSFSDALIPFFIRAFFTSVICPFFYGRS